MFEFDEEKSKSNKDKHGIDFVEIQALWDDEALYIMPSKDSDEKRYLCMGLIEDKYWTVITTMRNGKIRIISARRSRKKEIEAYESRRS